MARLPMATSTGQPVSVPVAPTFDDSKPCARCGRQCPGNFDLLQCSLKIDGKNGRQEALAVLQERYQIVVPEFADPADAQHWLDSLTDKFGS